jgi:hypothetical protein
MTLDDRAIIVGHTPTAGAAGAVTEVKMPEDESFGFAIGRPFDADGNLLLEGIGVVPDIDVPLDEATIFSEEDVVLQAAVRFLVGETIESEAVSLSNPYSGTLAPNIRVQHIVNLEAGTAVNILVESVSGENIILRILDPSGAEINETGADTIFLFADLVVDEDTAVVFEIRAEDGAATVDYMLSVEDSG